MEQYVLFVAGFGILALLTAWLPMILQAAPLSLPICFVAIGAALSRLAPIAHLVPRTENLALIQHATEAVVVVSLMGAGLKIDRPIGWRRWSMTWRMLGLAMPLTILALTALAMVLMGLDSARRCCWPRRWRRQIPFSRPTSRLARLRRNMRTRPGSR